MANTLTKGGNLPGFSIQYLNEEGPWGTWNIVLFQVPQLGPPIKVATYCSSGQIICGRQRTAVDVLMKNPVISCDNTQ